MSPGKAELLWSDVQLDYLGESSTGLYAAIDSLTIGSFSTEPDSLIAVIKPEFTTSSTFFWITGDGAIEIDVTLDGITDYYAFAPNVVLDSSLQSYPVSSANGTPTSCSSQWYLSGTNYAVVVPWRCLGAPASFMARAWLSNDYGYDFGGYLRVLTPIMPAVSVPTTPLVTDPPVTVPPVTNPPVTLPPETTVPATTLPPVTAPPVASVDLSRPGFVNDFIDYLVVNQPVTATDVRQSTDCCYGKKGVVKMTVSTKSKRFCRAKGPRLYPLRPGRCTINFSITTKAGGKSKITKETLRLEIKAGA